MSPIVAEMRASLPTPTPSGFGCAFPIPLIGVVPCTVAPPSTQATFTLAGLRSFVRSFTRSFCLLVAGLRCIAPLRRGRRGGAWRLQAPPKSPSAPSAGAQTWRGPLPRPPCMRLRAHASSEGSPSPWRAAIPQRSWRCVGAGERAQRWRMNFRTCLFIGILAHGCHGGGCQWTASPHPSSPPPPLSCPTHPPTHQPPQTMTRYPRERGWREEPRGGGLRVAGRACAGPSPPTPAAQSARRAAPPAAPKSTTGAC